MTNQIESQSKLSDWILHVQKKIFSNSEGQFRVKDNLENPILLEWEYISPSEHFNQRIKSLSEILVHTYTQLELQFAKKYPEAVPNEFFLKSLAPFFQEGSGEINWVLIEEKIKNIFHQFFTSTDFSKYSNDNDIYLFVIAKDERTGNTQGVIQFLISPDYAYGTAKACYFGIMPKAQGQGLDKLLMGSVFKLLPDVTRIFLHTRSTNEEVINNYLSWGFKQFNESMPNWPDFEYLTGHSMILHSTK